MPEGVKKPAITCVVADDHPAVLEAVAEFLTLAGIEVVGRARDGEEALQQIEERKPRIALVDVRMPGMGGIEVARRASRSAPATSVLLYTGYGDQALLTEALDAGVAGFVLKEAPMDDLVRAVESVAAGSTYVDPVLAGTLAVAAVGGTLPSSPSASATCCGCWPTVSRTRRSGRSSSSRRRPCARTCARRWTSSTPTRARPRSPVPCATHLIASSQ